MLNRLFDPGKYGRGKLPIRQASLLSVFLLCSLTFSDLTCSSALARFITPEVVVMPVEKVFGNLSSYNFKLHPADPTEKVEKALAEFALGRLQAMLYASSETKINILRYEFLTTGVMWPDYDSRPYLPVEREGTATPPKFKPENEPIRVPVVDHMQFAVTTPTQGKTSQKHLSLAIQHLQKSLTLDPSRNSARMALAWCYEQSHQKRTATKMYREVFNEAYAAESRIRDGFEGCSLTVTSGNHLIHLLDPKRDRSEIKEIERKISIIHPKFCFRC